MGTTSTSGLTSSSLTAPLPFAGVSQFSSDFQSVLTRAVQIAQLPVQALQNDQTTLQGEQQALTALEPDLTSVGSAIAALGTLSANGGLGASSSNSSIVTAVNTGASGEASYTISNIMSLASAAQETSLTGYANSATAPISASGYVNLVVGSNTYQLNISGNNNLTGLETAINNAGAGVNATILTTGTGATPDFLTISANSPGATTLQLNDLTNPTDLVSNTNSGTETSLTTYANPSSTPVSSKGYLNLVVGSKTYNLNIASNNNLNGLVQAINNANAGVTASVSGNSLSISTNNAGATTIQLNDLTPADLISGTNQGTNANFSLNGVPVQRSNNTINDLIPGLSLTLNSTTSSTGSATISLETDPSQLSSALQSLVSTYNAALADVAAQSGQSGGALTGNLVIQQISQDLQQMVTYFNPSGTSSIHSLSDLGVSFSNTGQMSFDQTTFNGLSDSQISDALSFFGSSNSGFAALANNFTQLTDPISGLIQSQQAGYTSENTQLTNQIATLNAQVSAVETNEAAVLEAADAAAAELESEQSTLSATLESVDFVDFGAPVQV
jgi:flagellar hook-associated protein 2